VAKREAEKAARKEAQEKAEQAAKREAEQAIGIHDCCHIRVAIFCVFFYARLVRQTVNTVMRGTEEEGTS
jgi:hypothetical protein